MPEQVLQKDDYRSLNFLSTLQSIATKRSLNPYAKGEQVTYEFTEDPALLHQYYRIREVRYGETLKSENYNWGEDFHDKLSHILIARRGKLCLGGCRLTIREGDEDWTLPVENDEFNLRKTFPNLHLDRVKHAEISRFVVMEDGGTANDDIFYGLCKAMYERVVSSDIHYLFAVSSYILARNWRAIANSFGVKTTKIVENIHPVEKALGDEVKWYLVLSDLTSFRKNVDSVVNSVSKTYYNEASEILN
jgi:hypothetical protein